MERKHCLKNDHYVFIDIYDRVEAACFISLLHFLLLLYYILSKTLYIQYRNDIRYLRQLFFFFVMVSNVDHYFNHLIELSENEIQVMKDVDKEWRLFDLEFDDISKKKLNDCLKVGTNVMAKWGKDWYKAKVNEIITKKGKIFGYDVHFEDNTLFTVKPKDIYKI
jgi:hypothetical protein